MDGLVQEHRCAATDDANEQGHDEERFGLEDGVIPQQVGELDRDETFQTMSGSKPGHNRSVPFFSMRSPPGKGWLKE
jgi:hypothetical protein